MLWSFLMTWSVVVPKPFRRKKMRTMELSPSIDSFVPRRSMDTITQQPPGRISPNQVHWNCADGLNMQSTGSCMLLHTIMMMSSNRNIFRITGPLCGEFTSYQWIPLTKNSDAELWCSLWSALWINGWVNNHEVGDWRCYRTHYDAIVMFWIYVDICIDIVIISNINVCCLRLCSSFRNLYGCFALGIPPVFYKPILNP